MASDYKCTVGGRLGRSAEWLPEEITFNNIRNGWDISLSKKGFVATRKNDRKLSENEFDKWRTEAREIATRLLDSVTYLMDYHSTRSKHRHSDTATNSGRGGNSIIAELPSPTYTLTVSGPPPSVSDIQEFWRDLEENLPRYNAVSYYLDAVNATSETEAAASLYKAVEIIEQSAGGERVAPSRLGFSKSSWKMLMQNLNYRRHAEGTLASPKRELSLEGCRGMVREIIEKLRSREQTET